MKPLPTATHFFEQLPVQFVTTETAQVAYREMGSGDPLIFIHGWPFNSFTFHRVAFLLKETHRCILFDSPGLGQSIHTEQTDFSFPAQAKTFKAAFDALGLDAYQLVAHDTGATIARCLALIDAQRMEKLVILNTETAGHRPPWLPLYRQLMFLPITNTILRQLVRSDWYLRSSMGFGGCYMDKAWIDGEFKAQYINPMRHDNKRMEGLNRYLRGLSWQLVDELEQIHAQIKLPVLLIWGADDPTFPVEFGRKLAAQLPNCVDFIPIPNAKLLVQEEKPHEVAAHMSTFLLME